MILLQATARLEPAKLCGGSEDLEDTALGLRIWMPRGFTLAFLQPWDQYEAVWFDETSLEAIKPVVSWPVRSGF